MLVQLVAMATGTAAIDWGAFIAAYHALHAPALETDGVFHTHRRLLKRGKRTRRLLKRGKRHRRLIDWAAFFKSARAVQAMTSGDAADGFVSI